MKEDERWPANPKTVYHSRDKDSVVRKCCYFNQGSWGDLLNPGMKTETSEDIFNISYCVYEIDDRWWGKEYEDIDWYCWKKKSIYHISK